MTKERSIILKVLMGSMILVAICIIFFAIDFPFFKTEASDLEIDGSLKDYNVIVIVIDSLRADHLGRYGYPRQTSPFIDSLAKEGLVFDRALSNSSFTAESVSVLFTGRLPGSGGSVGWGARPAKKSKPMARFFKGAGFRTAFFSSSSVVRGKRFKRGFDENMHGDKWGVSGNSPKLSARAAEFIKKQGDKKFFMYLHYLDPHAPYMPPDEYYFRMAKEKFPGNLSLYGNVRINCAKLIEDGFGPGERRFENLVKRYDAEIALVDNSIKTLFGTLKEMDVHKKTLIVITADHGEEFLEHQFVEHAWTLYNEVLHVPMIFWAPKAISSKRIDSLVCTVDLLPTILGITGLSHQGTVFDGEALFSEKGEGFRFKPREKPYIGELFIQHRSLIRTVIKDDWKYIAAQRWLEPKERPSVLENVRDFEQNKSLHLDIYGPVVHEELYDLSVDPGEKFDLHLREQIRLRQLKKILDEYKTYCHQKGLKNGPEKDKKSEKELEQLKSLGYI